MKVIEDINELKYIMTECYYAHKNTWYKSDILSDMFFWNTKGDEYNTYPTIYTTLQLLQESCMKLFGTRGRLNDNNRL